MPCGGCQGCRKSIPALPFCHVTLTASRPLPPAYPQELKTIGDYIRKKRLDLGLYQKDVAQRLGVTTDSVTNWEKGRSSPRLHLIPKIVEFPGYSPLPDESSSFGGRIIQARRAMGVRQDQLARQLGVDPSTLARWERQNIQPHYQHLWKLEAFFQLVSKEIDR